MRRNTLALVASLLGGLAALAIADPPAKPADAAPTTAPNAQAEAAAEAPANPASVLKRMRKRYDSARTYRDTGTSVSRFSGGSNQTKSLSFSTAFDRQAGFRWRFHDGKRDEGTAYEVWSPDRVKWSSWWGLTRKLGSFGDFQAAIAGPTGISSGTVQVVPVMLVEGSSRCDLLNDLRTRPGLDRATVDGVACDVVEGTLRGGRTLRLFVDADGTLRRYTESYDLDPAKLADSMPDADAERIRNDPKFHIDQQVDFKPVFDEPVKAEETRFTPPDI